MGRRVGWLVPPPPDGPRSMTGLPVRSHRRRPPCSRDRALRPSARSSLPVRAASCASTSLTGCASPSGRSLRLEACGLPGFRAVSLAPVLRHHRCARRSESVPPACGRRQAWGRRLVAAVRTDADRAAVLVSNCVDRTPGFVLPAARAGTQSLLVIVAITAERLSTNRPVRSRRAVVRRRIDPDAHLPAEVGRRLELGCTGPP